MLKNDYKKFFDFDAILSKVKEYMPDADINRIMAAFSFAEKAHKGQIRRDGKTPYITHPVETFKILSDFFADEDTLITALLHDVPEDTDSTLEEIQEKFGKKIAFLVNGVTKLSKVHYQHDMTAYQVESLKKLLLHTSEDLRVILIKLADRLHNMRTLENIENPNKRARIATETLEIYVPIANLLGVREIKNQLEDLCFKHLFPTEYEVFSKKLKEMREKSENSFNRFIEAVSDSLNGEKIKFEIFKHPKNIYSVYKKLCSLGKSIEDIDNRITVKIVVDKIPECYRVLGCVHSLFVPKTDRFKDYIANPKKNGYQSLHTVVFGVGGVRTEVQIRTKKMDIRNEYGVAANFYYAKDSEDFDLSEFMGSEWVKNVLQIEKSEKNSSNFMENLKLDIFQDRIVVFTPKGEPIDLPKGATIIDFAYSIHSDLGHHASKAYINGEIKPITATLKTSDVVNVISSSKIKPELSWLSFTRTNLARKKILSYLNKISREKKIQEGYKILQKEFDIAGLGLCKEINFKKLKIILKENFDLNCANLDDLFIGICKGDVNAIKIANYVKETNTHKPLIGGKIDTVKSGIRVYIQIGAKNRFGLLRDITEVLYKYAQDMYTLKGWASRLENDAFFTTEILVADSETISHIFDELKQMEEVYYVYRISWRGVIIFNFMVGLIVFGLIFHPFLIAYASRAGFLENHVLTTSILIYGSLLLLLIAMIYISHMVKKYLPIGRNKKITWIIAFTIPIFAISVLALEVLIFKVDLSWSIILSEIFLLYMYLSLSYLSFRKSMEKT